MLQTRTLDRLEKSLQQMSGVFQFHTAHLLPNNTNIIGVENRQVEARN